MKTIILLLIIVSFNIMRLSAQSNLQDVQMKVNHIAIAVTDLSESEQFYRDIIGLKQIPEPFKVGRHAWFDLGHAELHVIKAADERIEHNKSNHLCFSVDDLDAFIEKITSHGVEYSDFPGNTGKINVRPDGIRQIYFTDPDGYWVEINDDF